MSDDAPQLIGRAKSLADPSSPGFWAAALYRLPTGDMYVLAGTGGAESEFAPETPEDKGKSIELSETEAYNWAASHLPIDTVEEYFDHLIEEI